MLTMTGRTFIILINTAFILAMKFILNTMLIPRFGLNGAAMASTCSIMVLNIFMVIEVFYLLRIHPYERTFLKPILSGTLAFVVIYSTKNILPIDNLWTVPILAFAFMTSYIVLLLLFGINEEDRAILNIIRKKIAGRGS